MKRRLLIDGDILIYKIATQNEVDTHWGDGMWTLVNASKQGNCILLINF